MATKNTKGIGDTKDTKDTKDAKDTKDTRQTFHNSTLEKTTEARRQKIFEVTISEFSKRGYNGASINDIARKAGISIGGMYKYFSSKEDLFLSVLSYFQSQLENTYKHFLENEGSGFKIIENMFLRAKGAAINFPKYSQIYHYATTTPMEHMFKKVFDNLEPISKQMLDHALKRIKEEKNVEFDEKFVALTIDNLLIMCELSFSSSYYKSRLALYLDRSEDDPFDDFIHSSMQHIEKMILGENVEYTDRRPL